MDEQIARDSDGMPSRSAVARYWLWEPEARDRLPHLVDLIGDFGEPRCFACGWYDHEWPTAPDVAIGAAWDAAKGLERAHLRPRSLGGTDDPSNLVLLCDACHRQAPDVADPKHMLRWMATRPRVESSLHVIVDEAVIEANRLGYDPKKLLAALEAHPDFLGALREAMETKLGQHFGVSHNPASLVVIIADVLGVEPG